METRLLNDYRFIMLEERNQLLFLKILMFLRITNNKIPNDLEAIEMVLRTKRPLSDLQVSLDLLKNTFPKFKSNKHFYYMDGWDERFKGGKLKDPKKSQKEGVDEDEDIDEDIDSISTSLWEHFLSLTSKKFTLTPARTDIIIYRLKQGYTQEQLKYAMSRFVEDPWPDRKKYMDIKYCLGTTKKDVSTLEKWLNQQPVAKQAELPDVTGKGQK